MFKRKTLFVVGAGASAEYGLPPGKLLATKISTKMDIRFEFANRPIGNGDMDIYIQLTRACLQLSKMIADASCSQARKFLASLS